MYIHSFPSLSELQTKPLEFESLLLHDDPSLHVVSQLYSLLLSASFPDLPSYTQTWEFEIHHSIPPSDWLKCFALTHKFSLATKHQETGFKVTTRWYRCPSVIHNFNCSTPDTCWRCGSSRGTMIHIWWECPPIRSFWQHIFDLYCNLMSTSVQPTSEIALLSILLGYFKSIKKRGPLTFLIHS